MNADTTTIANEYRRKVLASGDKAEWAAIDGMPDAFVAAVAIGDFDAVTKILEG